MALMGSEHMVRARSDLTPAIDDELYIYEDLLKL